MSTLDDETSLWNGVKTDKCISLDIDATLVNTFSKISSLHELDAFGEGKRDLRKRIYTIDLHDVLSEPGAGVYSRMWGVFRPGWPRFHDFARRYFKHVIIWSAGQPHYVNAMVDVLFPDPDFQPLLVYNYKHCDVGRDNISKPLTKLYRDKKIAGLLKASHTYHLDDRDDTFASNKGNGILIPVYSTKPTIKGIMKEDDTCLLELEAWLSRKEVAESKDVRALKKDRIFKKKPKS